MNTGIRVAWLLCLVLGQIGWLGSSRAEDPFDIEKDKKRIGEDGNFNFDEVEGKLSLRFYDAVTGNPIAGGQVTLGEETRQTDAGGLVTFAYPRLGREEGVLDVLFEKKGYVRSVVKIHMLLDSVFIHRYSISPTLPSGRYRITLDWAPKPPDLDAHLIKEGRYHISFHDMKRFEDQAWLDRDDRDGEGPETITISQLDPNGRYVFYVHDYNNRSESGFSKFGKSRAHVMIFNDGGVVQSFEVPEGQGRVWKVFEIANGQIIPASKIIDSIP